MILGTDDCGPQSTDNFNKNTMKCLDIGEAGVQEAAVQEVGVQEAGAEQAGVQETAVREVRAQWAGVGSRPGEGSGYCAATLSRDTKFHASHVCSLRASRRSAVTHLTL